MNTFSCNVFIEHSHNHAVNSFEPLSFKVLPTGFQIEIEVLFSSDLTHLQAYNKFLRNLQSNSEDKLNFHLRKTDRSNYQRIRGFNLLCIKYCHEEFRCKNNAEMFDNEFTESNEGAKISYQLFNKD